MAEEIENMFSRGAEWVRADFHLHTLKEPGASRQKLRAEFRDKENSFVKAWVDELVKSTIRVAVVTNHNHFDVGEFKALRKAARKEGILVLPGLELGINGGKNGIHTLVVFSPDWVDDPAANDGIDRFLKSQFTATPDEGTRTRDDISGCLEQLDSYNKDYFLVFAHVQSDNGLVNELNWGTLKETIERCNHRWHRVLGLQKVTNAEALEKHWPVGLPAFVEGSDPRDSITEISKAERACWIKIGDLSFEAVRFALMDHNQRVVLKRPEVRSGPALHSVRFEGGLLDGQEYGLSEQLTTLIGSRGSGKSSVIECLRYALGQDPSDDDAKYKNGLVKAMLANGADVIVTGRNEHNQLVEIRRPLGFDPKVYLEGAETRLRPTDVLPGLLYFGQKDLGTRRESFEAEFFAQLTGARTAQDREQESKLEQKVIQAVADFQAVQKARGLDDEYAQEQERLKHQLAIYADKGVEERLSSLTVFDADRRSVKERLDQLLGFSQQFRREDAAWREIMSDWPELKSPSLKDASARLKAAFDTLQSLKAKFDQTVEGVGALSKEVESILASVKETERSLQEGFAQLQREINEPGLNLDEYRKKKSRHSQLVKLQEAAANRVQAEQTSLSKVLSAGEELYRFRRELHRREEAGLLAYAKSIPDSIKLSTRFEDDRDAFGQFLSDQLKGQGFRATTRQLIVEKFRNGLAIFEKRDRLEEELGAGADVGKLRTALFANLQAFLTYRVPDRREITFNGTPVAQLSLGQRATAILSLLTSLDRHPIMLLDQPEDDLDNETIFRNVVEPLRDRKKRCQFIIATHNANIPVLGDAEQIHACREVQKGEYVHQSGSLDCPATSKTIVDIMEGGAEAFLRRQKVLQQWTKSVSDKKS